MEILWKMTLSGSIATGWVLFARLLLRRGPKIFSYALWAVVLLRLLCPIFPQAPVSLMAGSSIGEIGWISDDVGETNAVQKADTETTQQTPVKLEDIVKICWVLGVAAMLGISLVKLLRLKGQLREAIHLRENIYLSDWVESPFVMGIVRPRIYLPARNSMEEFMLIHEKCHIRRLDHIWKALGYGTLCLHWFNPLVWLAYRLFCRDMEMSCDEAVLRRMGGDIRSDYGESLLRLSSDHPAERDVLPAFGEGDVQMRIKNVLNWKRSGKLATAGCLVLCLMVLAGCAVDPVRETVIKKSTVIYDNGDVRMQLELPEGWEYKCDHGDPEGEYYEDYYRIAFWQESFDTKKEYLSLMYYPNGFMAYHAYQKTDYVLDNGANVRVGVLYEEKDVWDYLYFLDEEESYVLLAEGTMDWWGEYGEECSQIINSIQIG